MRRLKSSGGRSRMISREKRKEYLKASGSFCINCGSGNISAGRIESEAREAWQSVVCYDCGSEWNDIFRLIGVDEIRLVKDEPVDPRVCGIKESNAKPFKPQHRWRKAALTLGKGVRLFQYCLKLLVAAREVIRNWERGDLAAAVRNLDAVVKEIERFLRAARLRSRFTSRRNAAMNHLKC
jgi:hypothetical protein